MIIRAILPSWATQKFPDRRRVVEGELNETKIKKLNELFYNIYYLPNHPTNYDSTRNVEGSDIDTFKYVFVDMDLKEGKYPSKDAFYEALGYADIPPSRVVDSGNGVHVYWQVSDLDAMSYLKLQRRLMRKFNTDEAVGQIFQLMRLPGTVNTKHEDKMSLCEELITENIVYTCEQLDALLFQLTHEDEQYCQDHFNKTYSLTDETVKIDDKLPAKFGALLKSSKEVKEIWTGNTDDRSKGDFRIGHIMFASGFTKEEATSVLVNSAKAMARGPKHRVTYALNIIDKIWTYELEPEKTPKLSCSVKEILSRGEAAIKGIRFACNALLDNTVHGFRLGQVIGLVAGSGVGKTTMAMNMFRWFTELNPEYDHFFVSLEQPDNEIADRWRTICQQDDRLHDKVHVLSNYTPEGEFRHLSLDDIKDYLLEFKKSTGRQIGTCVIDHIGALKKQSKNGENQALVDICHQMKAFAVQTNTMVIMQSQAPREKAGIGDIELNKDAAYGTVFFESYVDYLLTIWQPLKRVYSKGAPTVMAFKFCKIRHKNQQEDAIKEDICYQLMLDTQTQRLRELTQTEETSAKFHLNQATNARKQDRKTEIIPYVSRRVEGEDGKTSDSKDAGSVTGIKEVH